MVIRKITAEADRGERAERRKRRRGEGINQARGRHVGKGETR